MLILLSLVELSSAARDEIDFDRGKRQRKSSTVLDFKIQSLLIMEKNIRIRMDTLVPRDFG
jgi:hypothetical protein